MLLIGGSLFLLSDYFHIASNQYQLQKKLLKKKEELKKQFYSLEAKLNDLRKEFFQLRDFNKKIRTITSIDYTNQKQYGKISSDSNLLALSAPSFPERDLASSPDIPEKKVPITTSSAKEPASLYRAYYTKLMILNKKKQSW